MEEEIIETTDIPDITQEEINEIEHEGIEIVEEGGL